MAKEIVVNLIDDLDGRTIEDGDGGTVEFALQGRRYELDLRASNLAKLEKAVAPFIQVARAAKATRTTSQTPRRRKSTTELAEIREWARAQGITVSDYGRIPVEVRTAYAASRGNGS